MVAFLPRHPIKIEVCKCENMAFDQIKIASAKTLVSVKAFNQIKVASAKTLISVETSDQVEVCKCESLDFS